ncbi:peptidyl-prolyl cis-trans isomerase-like 3 [Lachnospiraceae bacterium XBB1006]|nr:peptidyl-prolyl cis-trans isomerase-like 3 [Lachnospiraceae bacterium XBB1006]
MKTVRVKMKNHGAFSFTIKEEIAPKAVARMLAMIEMKKYDGKVIERLEPGFVIQPLFQDGVDEEIDVMVEPEYETVPENHAMKFERGTVAMAGDGKKASGSQFFVTLDRQERLDGKFTVIGEIVDGWEEIERLEAVSVVECIDEPSGFVYHKPEIAEVVESVVVE